MSNKFWRRNTRAAKVDATVVQEIRMEYDGGLVTQGDLARKHGLSVVQVGRIVRRESWQAVPEIGPSSTELQESAARMAELQRQVSGDTPLGQEALMELMSRRGEGAAGVLGELEEAIAEKKQQDRLGDRLLDELKGDQGGDTSR